MEDNRILKDIHWLMAKLYLALDNVGADANNMSEYKTLCERYGFNVDDADDALDIRRKGIG